MKELNFSLPYFMHYCWTGDIVRRFYESQIFNLKKIRQKIEIESVANGSRQSCLIQITASQQAETIKQNLPHSFEIITLKKRPTNCGYIGLTCNSPFNITVLIAEKSVAKQFMVAESNRDPRKMGSLLEYPECCTDFFYKTCLENNYRDPTWDIALNSNKLEYIDNVISILAVPETNIFLSYLGLEMIDYFPCSFNCELSIRNGKRFIERGMKLGFKKEMETLAEILNFPLEWSSLHGISEIINPLFKISTRTDATKKKYIIKLIGNKK